MVENFAREKESINVKRIENKSVIKYPSFLLLFFNKQKRLFHKYNVILLCQFLDILLKFLKRSNNCKIVIFLLH